MRYLSSKTKWQPLVERFISLMGDASIFVLLLGGVILQHESICLQHILTQNYCQIIKYISLGIFVHYMLFKKFSQRTHSSRFDLQISVFFARQTEDSKANQPGQPRICVLKCLILARCIDEVK